MPREKLTLNRREALQHLGAIGIGAAISACGNGSSDGQPTAVPTNASTPTVPPTSAPSSTVMPTVPSTPPHTPSPSPTRTVTPDQVACILSPAETLGPYFIDVGLARSDIREDRAGVRLRLALQLVEADTCAPIRDAVVNVWHADAAGIYSGFPGQLGGVDTTGEKFLRGFQVTDADGRVELVTIYPGWYPGRTVHVHVRIHLDSTTVLVTHLYFPDALTDVVFSQAPYSSRPNRDTINTADSIARNDLDELLLNVVADDDGYAGSIVLGAAL